MERLKIALSQMRCEKGQIERNLKEIENYMRQKTGQKEYFMEKYR
jgi:flagellar biosynthesis chaperone FliJ